MASLLTTLLLLLLLLLLLFAQVVGGRGEECGCEADVLGQTIDLHERLVVTRRSSVRLSRVLRLSIAEQADLFENAHIAIVLDGLRKGLFCKKKNYITKS